MPLTIITLKNTPASLRGDLTKRMQEINTGVYLGNFNTKIREKLWQRVIESVVDGEATICYAQNNEIGYNIETHNTKTQIIDLDGIPLVAILNTPKSTTKDDLKLGYSDASKFRKAKQYRNKFNNSGYVVIDIETTGIDLSKDNIIEIGCIKIKNKILEEYQALIKIDDKIPKSITDLTGIHDELMRQNGKDEKIVLTELLEFIKDLPIITYGNNFDIAFINKALLKHGMPNLINKHVDLMKLAKIEKRMLANYKLATVLEAYDINKNVDHRAIDDARLIYELSTKINIFSQKLKSNIEI